MRGIEQLVVFPVFKRGREIENIQCFGQVLQGIVKISGFFSVIQDDQVIQLGEGRMSKCGGNNKLGGTAS